MTDFNLHDENSAPEAARPLLEGSKSHSEWSPTSTP